MWADITLKDGIKIQMSVPPFLIQVTRIHAEAHIADRESPEVPASIRGYREAGWIAQRLCTPGRIPPQFTAEDVRSCRKELIKRFKAAIRKAGHKFRAPPLFEYKPQVGTRLTAEEVVIYVIPDPPDARKNEAPGSSGSPGSAGPPSPKED